MAAGKATIREYFDRDARGYLDAYHSPGSRARGEILRERRRLVLELLQDPLGRVLDAGCGPGAFGGALIERGGECYAFDHSLAMVTASREEIAGLSNNHSRAHHGVADIEALPLPATSFDTVLCVGVLQYLAAPDRAVAELARVTRAGGQLVISFPNRWAPLNLVHRAVVAALRAGRKVIARMGVETRPAAQRLTFREDIPNRMLATREVAGWARAAGLRVECVVHYSFHFPFSVPGAGAMLETWDRVANRALSRGPLRHWGREAIIRLVRA